MTSRPGRKPLPGERYPSGGLKRPGNASAPAPAAIKRAVDAALRGAGDPRWGSTVGRLRLENVLTDRQFGAAEAYGRLRGKHDRAIGLPRRSAAGILYDLGEARGDHEMSDDAIGGLRADHEALLRETGPLRPMLDRIVLDDQAPLPGELPRLRAALEMLAEWLGVGRE